MAKTNIVKLSEEELSQIDSRKIFERMNWKAPDPNDPELEPDQILCYLSLGSRKPQNAKERGWLQSIKESEQKDYVKEIEIPFN